MHNYQSGNMLFIILIAVILIGSLTAAVMNGGDNDNAHIDKETLSIRVSEIQRYASELERAISFISNNGISENSIRFAHINAPSAYGDITIDSDKSDQVFARQGGGAAYRSPPEDISSADQWEFYGETSIPSMGSDRADLIAVLPNVTPQFCDAINTIVGQPTGVDTPEDSGSGSNDCLYMGASARFGDSDQFSSSPNTLDPTTFTQDSITSAAKPAPQACIKCERDDAYHFYHVILAR